MISADEADKPPTHELKLVGERLGNTLIGVLNVRNGAVVEVRSSDGGAFRSGTAIEVIPHTEEDSVLL